MRFTKAERRLLQRITRQGGIARARSLSASRRRQIAIRAAVIRWTRLRAEQVTSK